MAGVHRPADRGDAVGRALTWRPPTVVTYDRRFWIARLIGSVWDAVAIPVRVAAVGPIPRVGYQKVDEDAARLPADVSRARLVMSRPLIDAIVIGALIDI